MAFIDSLKINNKLCFQKCHLYEFLNIYEFIFLSIQGKQWVKLLQDNDTKLPVADPGTPEGAPAPWGNTYLLFGMIFAENCMKMKKNWT